MVASFDGDDTQVFLDLFATSIRHFRHLPGMYFSALSLLRLSWSKITVFDLRDFHLGSDDILNFLSKCSYIES